MVALPDGSGATDVLYVTGAMPAADSDQRVVFEMERMGFTVTVLDDDVVTSGDAAGRDLVFLSSTVSGVAVGLEFTDLAVPLVSRQSGTFPALGMTGAIGGLDFGVAPSQSTVDATGTHPLSAGLSGPIAISATDVSDVHWGAPGAGASIGVTLAGDPTRAASFGYEAGAMMVAGVAPARRVGLFPDDDTPLRWSADVQDLLRASLLWALDETSEDRVRVAALGDSITLGKAGNWSWRRPLGDLLEAAECRVDMTGTQFGPDSGAPGDFLYDRDHEGHSGYRTDEVVALLDVWLQGSVPDVAIVHLGTNDVAELRNLDDAKEHLRTVIGQFRAANPDVAIVLAQIIPVGDPASMDDVPIFNGHIADLAAEEHTVASSILLVDQFTDYDIETMSGIDGVHPNHLGEQHIADRFFAALRPRITSYCAAPPVPALGQSARALLVVLALVGGLVAAARGRGPLAS